MPWFDFVIADRYALPEELTPYFTEKPLYVDGSFIPLTQDETPARQATRAEFGLPEDAFVMAAFGNVYKLNEDILKIWVNILAKNTNAVLWLVDDNYSTTEKLKRQFQIAGISYKRIIFTKRDAHSEYRAKLAVSDIYLDSFPYNCGSTTRDVLNAGVPIVTQSGGCMVSRMGGSILSSLGLTELIANNTSQYENIVSQLVHNPEYLSSLKNKLIESVKKIQNNQNILAPSIENKITAMLQA
jgi:predicted O-linked N-acetylglucosamine transferase (SPINDLY family)